MLPKFKRYTFLHNIVLLIFLLFTEKLKKYQIYDFFEFNIPQISNTILKNRCLLQISDYYMR